MNKVYIVIEETIFGGTLTPFIRGVYSDAESAIEYAKNLAKELERAWGDEYEIQERASAGTVFLMSPPESAEEVRVEEWDILKARAKST